ncbi:uncharacterized protein N7459_002197 [Penicillium hispanicum]|uniref:uncharacterized protein n=1 Tax=Penicillium hispanicum TaxID=1080232 RepID=UPI00254101C0|nr:uncharacterized protein N7459_002197 [Penicillium hispanicum]KAJ5591828.1 hypothetical protein N7459_002197 [Penicillium hispanicum]
MNADMLGFLCLYSALRSENPQLDSPKSGVGTDMALPSPSFSEPVFVRAGSAFGEARHHDKTEPPRPPSPPDPGLRIVMEHSASEEVPASPSPLLLQPLQIPEDDPLVRPAGTSALPPSLCLLPTSEPETESTESLKEVQGITVLPPLSLELEVDKPESEVEAENTVQEHIVALPPHLASIPEDSVEEHVKQRITMPDSLPSATAAGSTPVPQVDSTTVETMETAWALSPPQIPESNSVSTSGSAIPQLESTGPAESSLISASEPEPTRPDTADTADTASTGSTNGDGSSVFDDYHSDTSSYTASLLSDVKNYTYENGRRYHSYREGHYVLPNDDQEQDRQDLLHHVRNLVLNGALFRAPLGSNMQRVLDIGTGTGIWAIDFADSYPSAEVVGTDLSPIQPSWVPPNLRFLVDDAESPWLFSANRPFDFIHARDLGGAIANWPRLLQQAYTHLRPGGWVELQEFEVTLKSDDDSLRLAPTLCEFLGRLHEASEAFNRPMNIAEGHRQRLVEAGFEDVRDEVYKVPSSGWSRDPVQKQIGRYNQCSLLMAVESYSLALFTRVLGWSNNDTQVFLAGVRRDLKDPDVHTYCNLHIVYGRKPWGNYPMTG